MVTIHLQALRFSKCSSAYCQSLCTALEGTNWDEYNTQTNEEIIENLGKMNNIDHDVEQTDAVASTEKGYTIIPIKEMKGLGKNCQVCAWEGRNYRTKNVVLCVNHGLRTCFDTPHDMRCSNSLLEEASNKSTANELKWLCPDREKSCHKKAHEF